MPTSSSASPLRRRSRTWWTRTTPQSPSCARTGCPADQTSCTPPMTGCASWPGLIAATGSGSVSALPVDDIEQWLAEQEAAQVVGEEPAVGFKARRVTATGDVRGQEDLRQLQQFPAWLSAG